MAKPIDRIAFACAVALISIALGLTMSPWWSGLTGFVGLNLRQSAFIGPCPLAMAHGSLGARPRRGA